MKKIAILFFLVSSITTLNAQSLKGKLFFQGSLGTSLKSEDFFKYSSNYYNIEPRTSRSFYINPAFGFYVSDQFALGIYTGYTWSTSKYPTSYLIDAQGILLESYSEEIKLNSFTIAPLLRYTKPLSDKFGFNFNLTLPYNTGKSIQEGSLENSPIYKTTITSIGVNLSPEVQYFISKRIALTASLGGIGYETSNEKETNSIDNYKKSEIIKRNYFNLDFTSNLQFGATIFFGGKE